MNFIKSIAENKIDDFAHKCFTRYGCGDYIKDVFKITKTSNAVKISGGFEWVTAMHRFMATIVDGNVHLQGNIITSKDIESDLKALGVELEEKKPQRGKAGYEYAINIELTPAKYKIFTSKLYDCYLLLHMNCGIRSISVKKTKMPKLGKVNANFLKAVFDVDDFKKVKDEFLFDVKIDSFKCAEIRHIYHVEDITIPKQYENDPEKARLCAKRKGMIERETTVDGNIIKTEIKMEV